MRRLDRTRYLSDAELTTLLAAAKGAPFRGAARDYMAVFLMVNSGLRVGELVRLDVHDLATDHEGRTALQVWRSKATSSRSVYLHPAVATVLERFLRGRRQNEPMFAWFDSTGAARRFSRRAIQKYVKRLGALARLPMVLTPHVLRHTYATNFYAATRDLRGLSEQLGHRSTRTTEIYAHLPPDTRAKLAASVAPRAAPRRPSIQAVRAIIPEPSACSPSL